MASSCRDFLRIQISLCGRQRLQHRLKIGKQVHSRNDRDTPNHVLAGATDVKYFECLRKSLRGFTKGTIHLFRKPQRSFFGKLLQEFGLVAADRRGTIHLFRKPQRSFFGKLLQEFGLVAADRRFLPAYSLLVVDLTLNLFFFLLSLMTCLISYWVMMRKPSPVYSFGVCGIIPGLSSVFLPRMNPFVLIDLAGAFALCITYMLIEINNYFAVDTASAIAIALMTFGTMYPMSVYSGKVLLQTTPPHVIGQLDKLLREVSTLDGVLEVRNEHFWTLGFGSLAGSVHVRIRRDANEQMVLAHVTNRLYTLVSTLTVQIFKDDWIRPSLPSGPVAANVLNFSDHHIIPMPPLKGIDESNPVTSTPTKPSSPPPEFSFNTPGKNVNPVILLNTQTRPYGLGLNHGHIPYSSVVNQGFGVPGIGATQGFRTGFTNIPSRYGTNNRIGQPRP
ncbi:Zinc transporter 6 [Myotis brandtii]|uniref:Zinc transporter 6 n=1 Tax=Myotis brandtii TaxID=109478 RepID=S7NQY4_MYOBR|nr:Zinc transporter 6 [Myotis brandtii]